MNIDVARRIISIAFNTRKDKETLTSGDFVKEIAYKRKLLSPDDVTEFLKLSVESNLLVPVNDGYKPTFSTSGVIIPLDFSVERDDLFKQNVDLPLAERMMEAAIASGKIQKDEIVNRVRDLQKHLMYVPYEIVLATVVSDEGIDISSFIKEVEAQQKK
ncbi:MAG: DUF2240 family protein [Thermoplasmata archaeon]